MSRILVKEDHSGKEHFVEYWLSKKGNMCWKLNGTVFVKMRGGGYTMMLADPDSNNWIPSNVHTKAKAPQASIPKAEIEKTRLVL